MICQMMGFPPISTIGFGLVVVSSDKRDPNPPASIKTFIGKIFYMRIFIVSVSIFFNINSN